MQQPAGFQDSIISKWRIESTSQEGQRLMSRDLNASYLSESARQASFLGHEFCHFEAGKIKRLYHGCGVGGANNKAKRFAPGC